MARHTSVDVGAPPAPAAEPPAGGLGLSHADVLAAVPDGILVCDEADTVVFCNARAAELLRRAPDRLVGRGSNVLAPVAEDGTPFVPAALPWRRAREEGRMVVGTVVGIPRDDGTHGWFAVSATPVGHGEGPSVSVVVTFEDIAARRRNEELVARLGRILEQSRDEVYVFDSESLRLLQVNRSAIAGSGHTMDQLQHMTPLDLMYKMSPEGFRTLLRPLLSGEVERVQFETMQRRHDGTTYPVEVSLQLLASESPPVVASLVLDISARFEAEREIRGREEENRRLANEQGALRRVATAVAREDDPQSVFDLVCVEARRLIGAAAAGLVRFDGGAAIRVGSSVARGATPAFAGRSSPLAGDIAAEVQRTGHPVRLAAERTVAVPVRAGDRLWGAIAVSAMVGEASDTAAVERLRRFAELVGIAVSNAEARARLAALAATDNLTDLANHRTFQERLAQEVDRATRHGRELSLVLIDIDHFKQVNDDLGHQMGDAVLREVARRLQSLARRSDLVARVGGDEFAWLIPEGAGMEAWRAADRAREMIAAEPFDGVGHLTVSAGVCDLEQAPQPSELYRLADGALYWAKHHGRDVAFLYSPEVVEVLSDAEQAERLARLQALQSIRVLARAVDAKDRSTRQHSERVAELAKLLARALGWGPEDAAALRDAGRVHDVGKIAVPDAILFKPDRLTDAEFERVKGHAALGAEIVADVLSDSQVAWVRGHHERWDGNGYPDGLAGGTIPEGARILTLADSWDVMTSERPYGVPLSHEDAIAECRRCAGTQFWPRAVDALEMLFADDALPRPGGPPG